MSKTNLLRAAVFALVAGCAPDSVECTTDTIRPASDTDPSVDVAVEQEGTQFQIDAALEPYTPEAELPVGETRLYVMTLAGTAVPVPKQVEVSTQDTPTLFGMVLTADADKNGEGTCVRNNLIVTVPSEGTSGSGDVFRMNASGISMGF